MDNSTNIVIKNKMHWTDKAIIGVLTTTSVLVVAAAVTSYTIRKGLDEYHKPIQAAHIRIMQHMCEKHDGLAHVIRREYNVYDVRCGDTAVFQAVKFTKIEDVDVPIKPALPAKVM